MSQLSRRLDCLEKLFGPPLEVLAKVKDGSERPVELIRAT